jgi:hypothetical protein
MICYNAFTNAIIGANQAIFSEISMDRGHISQICDLFQR